MNTIRISILTALMTAVACGAVLTPSVSYAQEDKLAESMRLVEEMNKLAGRNAWAGVERNYDKLVALKIELSFDVHYMGAQSARYLGKTWEVYERLERAKAIDPQEEIVSSMKAIDLAYGRVDITGNPRKITGLTRAAMPFAPDERKSIEWAKTVVLETGSFYGMLPAGQYGFESCDFTFDVKADAGTSFSDVVIPKECQGKGETIVYTGPIALLGGGYGMSPEPAQGFIDGVDLEQAIPSSVQSGGIAVGLGGEVGFTKTFGVAVTLGYNNMFGADSLHLGSAWLAAAIRPGDLRIALGPQYGVLAMSGTGITNHYQWDKDSDQSLFDEEAYPRETLPYKGSAGVGGGQLTVGYGLMDFGSLQGVVELGGSLMMDGMGRNYMSFGLRVGIVPKVPRFEG